MFPLPHTAAVDDMTMVMGERRIVGLIKRRDEARAVYERAIEQGATASLLEQERPNIFTQSVGNIKPGEKIHIEISYVDVLSYDMGTYEFHFPMVVGPRYIPGTSDFQGTGSSERTKGESWRNRGPKGRSANGRSRPIGHRMVTRHDPCAGCLANHTASAQTGLSHRARH